MKPNQIEKSILHNPIIMRPAWEIFWHFAYFYTQVPAVTITVLPGA